MLIFSMIRDTRKERYLAGHLSILFRHFLLLKGMQFICKEDIDNMEIPM